MFRILFIFFINLWPGYYAKIPADVNNREHFLITGGYELEVQTHAKHIVSIADLHYFDRREIKEFGAGHLCGGSIVGLKTILTAGHCVHNMKPDRIMIIAGTPIRNQPAKSTQILYVDSTTVHSNYRPTDNTPDDIALIHLKEKIVEDHKTAERIRIADESYAVPGVPCVAVGWGALRESGEMATKLQYVDLVVYNHSECKKELPPIRKTFCAGDPLGRVRGPCEGDSGGPLFCDNRLTGITIFGVNCSQVEPTFFTDISKYLIWIYENSKDDTLQISVGLRSTGVFWASHYLHYIFAPIILLLLYTLCVDLYS